MSIPQNNMPLGERKELADKRAMEEASRLYKPAIVKLKGENLENLLPMPPTEGPPLPRVMNIKWPWKK